jgi:hypothetical protein
MRPDWRRLAVLVLSIVFLFPVILPATTEDSSISESHKSVLLIETKYPSPVKHVGVVDCAFCVDVKTSSVSLIDTDIINGERPHEYAGIRGKNYFWESVHLRRGKRYSFSAFTNFAGSDGELSLPNRSFSSARDDDIRTYKEGGKLIIIFTSVRKFFQFNSQPSSFLTDNHVVLPLERVGLTSDDEQGYKGKQTCNEGSSRADPDREYVR